MTQRVHAGARGRVSWIAMTFAAGLSLIALAGFWGYHLQTLAWPIPVPTRPLAADVATSATDTVLQPATGYVPKPPAKPGERRLAAMGVVNGQPDALKWPMWEFLLRQPIPPRNPPLTPPAWRLIGASKSAGTWSIIVMRQGKAAPEYFKTGESLPGGYRIASITEEDVTLVKGKLPVILSYIGSR